MHEGQGRGFCWQTEEGKLNCLHLISNGWAVSMEQLIMELDGNSPQPISVMSLGPA
jgi:hypothetical protein